MRKILRIAAMCIMAAACGSKSPTAQLPQTTIVADAPITADALTAFMQSRFPQLVAAKTLELSYGSEGVAEEIVDELQKLGVTSMAQVPHIVPVDFDEKGAALVQPTTIAGLIRDLLIIRDTRAYFQTAWQHRWQPTRADFALPQAYGVTLEALEQLGIFGEAPPE